MQNIILLFYTYWSNLIRKKSNKHEIHIVFEMLLTDTTEGTRTQLDQPEDRPLILTCDESESDVSCVL